MPRCRLLRGLAVSLSVIAAAAAAGKQSRAVCVSEAEQMSLLQRGPEGARRHAGADPNEAEGHGGESDFGDDSFCSVDKFVRAQGYHGPHKVEGKVWLRAKEGWPQDFTAHLKACDKRCDRGSSGAANSCAIKVTEATSCHEKTGGSFYDRESRSLDPWCCLTYTTQTADDGSVTCEYRGPVDTGKFKGAAEFVGRTVHVFDYDGNAISCGVLAAGMATKATGLPPHRQHKPTLRASSFISRKGYTVSGGVSLESRPGSIAGLYITMDVTGVPPECSQGPEPTADGSCRLEIIDSTSCKELDKKGIWNPDALRINPWPCVGYVSEKDPDTGEYVSTLDWVPVTTGVSPEYFEGRVILLRDHKGEAISCGIAGKITG